MIPKIAHLYWGQDDLPFLRFLTVWTLANLNPDWRIVLHEPVKLGGVLDRTWDTPEHKGVRRSARSYRAYLTKIPNLEIRVHEDSKFPRGLSHVHRSDLLRWELLATEGGIWSDMDILWSRPLDQVPEIRTHEAFVCAWQQGTALVHSIGFLGSAPDTQPYARAWKIARAHASEAAGAHYQALGNQLLAQAFPPELETSPGVANLSRHVVYPYTWLTIREWIASAKEVSFRPETVGVHWFAGDAIATHYAMERVHEDFADPGRPSGLFASVRHALECHPLPVLSASGSGILTPRPVPLSSPRDDGRDAS